MSFKSGESGNPNGRPKGSKNKNPVRETIQKVLNEAAESGMTNIEKLTRSAISKALGENGEEQDFSPILGLMKFAVPPLRATSEAEENGEEEGEKRISIEVNLRKPDTSEGSPYDSLYDPA